MKQARGKRVAGAGDVRGPSVHTVQAAMRAVPPVIARSAATWRSRGAAPSANRSEIATPCGLAMTWIATPCGLAMTWFVVAGGLAMTWACLYSALTD